MWSAMETRMLIHTCRGNKAHSDSENEPLTASEQWSVTPGTLGIRRFTRPSRCLFLLFFLFLLCTQFVAVILVRGSLTHWVHSSRGRQKGSEGSELLFMICANLSKCQFAQNIKGNASAHKPERGTEPLSAFAFHPSCSVWSEHKGNNVATIESYL